MKKIVASLAVLAAPVVAFAQANSRVTDFNSGVSKLTGIGNTIIGILIAVAVIYIVYHVLQWIINAGGESGPEHRKAAIWGIVGLAVILSIWGLVAILTNTFGTTTGGQGPVNEFPINPNPPKVN